MTIIAVLRCRVDHEYKVMMNVLTTKKWNDNGATDKLWLKPILGGGSDVIPVNYERMTAAENVHVLRS